MTRIKTIGIIVLCITFFTTLITLEIGMSIFSSSLTRRSSIISAIVSSEQSHCHQDPWKNTPEVEFYVRLYHKSYWIYKSVLVPGMKLFLPNDTQMVAVMDDESTKDHICGAEMAKYWPFPRVYYEKPASTVYRGRGYDRQQLSMFYPDRYIKSEYVAYVDTDATFITLVTPEILFNGEARKPSIFGVYGKLQANIYREAAIVTKELFEDPYEYMRCMSYFPVIMKVQHIVELRKYLAKKHNRTFEEVFRTKIVGSGFSQFNIMCQYVYNFHRNEYSFHMHIQPDDTWKKQEPNRPPDAFYQNNFTDKQRSPYPRVSYHWNHHCNFKEKILSYPFKKEHYLHQALLEGVCFSGGFELCPTQCKYFNQSHLHRNMYKFEVADWSFDYERCMATQREHYANVKELRNYRLQNNQLMFGDPNPQQTCTRLEVLLNHTMVISIPEAKDFLPGC